MVEGLVEISKNIQLVDGEASAIQLNAETSKQASQDLLNIANDLESMLAKFRLN